MLTSVFFSISWRKHSALPAGLLNGFAHILRTDLFWYFFANQFSSPVVLKLGVPQGSVPGPLLFIIYTAELEDVVKTHDCRLYTYADDNQVYLLCRHSDSTAAAAKLENCVSEVNAWMASNRLKLNPAKTELMWFSTRHGLKNSDLPVLALTLRP